MTTNSNPFLRLEHLSKRYSQGGKLAVEDISLDIQQGEFLSLLGPSGSGKTTTLMMLAGFELPSSGRILLEGNDIVGIPAHRRNFGMVFQNYALFPHMTVFDNVAYPQRIRKLNAAQIDESVNHHLEMVGLSKFSARRPGELSGGQQQRVALARALVFDPNVVLMDEPLGALDKNLREQLQFEIKDLQRKLGITLVYVTHDQGEAMSMSDRIAVFNDGQIEQIAGPVEIYRNPKTHFVGQFVGESNFIEAQVDDPIAGIATSRLGTIKTSMPFNFERGTQVLAMIRPELIRLSSDPERHGTSLGITKLTHYGDRVLVEGQTADGDVLSLRVSHHEATDLAPGTRARVTWLPEDVHFLARK